MSTERDQQENAAALARMQELGINVTSSAGRVAPPAIEQWQADQYAKQFTAVEP